MTLEPESDDDETYRALDQPDTNNATYFDAEDVPAGTYWSADFLYLKKRTHYQYLDDMNSGKRNGPKYRNDPYYTRETARHLVESVACQLDLTERQTGRARRYFLGLDRERLGLPSELVVYCLCAYVLEQDERNRYRRCHPNVPAEQIDPVFRRVAESLGLRQRDIQKTYGKLQHRLT